MNSDSLDEFMSLNEQIAAMIGANVPTGLQLGLSRVEANAILERINASVARRVNRGESLADAIGEEATAPRIYRGVLEAGWRSGGVERAIEQASRLEETAEESRFHTRIAMLYPLLVCTLSIAGVIAFVSFVAPVILNLFREFRIPESPTLRLFEFVRSHVPELATLGLLALAVVLVTSALHRSTTGGDRTRTRWWSRATGQSQADFLARCASFCEQLAPLLDAGLPVAEAAQIAAEACGDLRLQEAAASFAATAGVGPQDGPQVAHDFPPFIRWAVDPTGGIIAAPAAVRIAATFYKRAAYERAQQVRVGLPIVASVFVGGGAVLLYGFALFLPITEMLQALAR
jgi:type II secretory pathway component PulF